MCDECRRRIEHRNYCDGCQPKAPHKTKKTLLAGLLSLVPGLGQLYVGHGARALLFFGGACFLAANADRLSLPEFAYPVLWFLNICDAVALSRRRNALPSQRSGESKAVKTSSSSPDRVFFGLTVAALGILVLLKSTALPMLSVTLMWPIAAVLFGLTLAVSRARP
jgi:TM2 domain-containing membrane protein YozV